MTANQHSTRAVLAACADLPKRNFAPGEDLLVEGPDSGRMLILIAGAVAVVRGDVQVALIDEPGAIFGEIAALLGIGHSATVKAVTPVIVHEIAAGEDFLQKRPAIMFHVARMLAGRLVDATSYLADIKHQYAGRDDHLGMVDAVLESLMQQQIPQGQAGTGRAGDPRL